MEARYKLAQSISIMNSMANITLASTVLSKDNHLRTNYWDEVINYYYYWVLWRSTKLPVLITSVNWLHF